MQTRINSVFILLKTWGMMDKFDGSGFEALEAINQVEKDGPDLAGTEMISINLLVEIFAYERERFRFELV